MRWLCSPSLPDVSKEQPALFRLPHLTFIPQCSKRRSPGKPQMPNPGCPFRPYCYHLSEELWLLNPCHLGPLFLFLQPPFNVGIIAVLHETAPLPPGQFRPFFQPTRNGYPDFSLELKLCDSAFAAPRHLSHHCQDTFFPTGSSPHQHRAEGKASNIGSLDSLLASQLQPASFEANVLLKVNHTT